MTRLLAALPLVLLGATLAQGQVKLEGHVMVAGTKVWLVGQKARLLEGPQARNLRVLAGKRVRVEARPKTGAGFEVLQILSPRRAELTAVVRQRSGGLVAVHDRKELRLFGAVDLLTADTRSTLDVWLFPDQACVLGVEADTQVSWTILRTGPSLLASAPIGWIRGKNRSVWVVRRALSSVLVVRGDDVGWTSASSVRVRAEPVATESAARRGLTDRVVSLGH